MSQVRRVPAGVRSGGQFTAAARQEAPLVLTGTPYDPSRVDSRRTANGDYLIAQIAHHDGVTRTGPGHPHLAAANQAAAFRRDRETGIELQERAKSWARQSIKVTALISSPTGVVRAREGALYRSPSGNLAILAKGARGTLGGTLLYRADDDSWRQRLLDLHAGYGRVDDALRTWRETAATMPILQEAAPERLPLVRPLDESTPVAAIFCSTRTAPDGTPAPGSLWFATHVEGEVVNGYGIAANGTGVPCGPGSVAVAELRSGGEVSGYASGALTLTGARDLAALASHDKIEAVWDRIAHVARPTGSRKPHIYPA
ncbi:hypothetical protein CHO01_40180 [Cellulomonas hominis]|uniref:Uncharacterized protein n=1 Tax=Cellulomonas hominis TaxID=156981 RepID=A0A511FI64_9CELL|nr:hypothetical protein [Cellulomonas hominis]MBB5474637.1 hypothetical protein [Cellulomonas hominis]NKY06005.1 hypothetical protein [Cellulomonas hominis]GEL48902.1 hypothetical protein CHO01_40180 [Cellulomonas hominis]